MKSLLAGEQLRETFAINCKFGKSTLYISNLGIMIENSKGIILELDHSSIVSLQPFDKKSVKIVWKEIGSTYDFVFNYEKPTGLTAKYKTIKDDCLSLLKTIGVKIEQQVKEKITIQNPVIEPRFEKIPPYVLNEQIWNDCWFDKEHNLYITHNKFFKEMRELQNRPHQIQYRIKSKDDGVTARPDKVVLKYGIPAVQIDHVGKKTWVMLPTMNKKLLTGELEAAIFATKTEERIEYFSEMHD